MSAEEAAELRVAVIGFGLGGGLLHAPLIAATPGLRVAGVVTSSEERARRAQEAHPGVAVFGSADALWERADEFELAVITTPNDAHVQLAEAAIERGLPVAVDKPLAPTAAAARELVALAESRGVPLTVIQNRRWDSDFLTVRRLIDAGEIGHVIRFETRFERWRPEAKQGAWRTETPRAGGGGVLLDLGAHLVDQALLLFGPAKVVEGRANRVRGGVADDDGFVRIVHESGTESLVWTSEMTAAPGPRLRVLGDRGAFVVDSLDVQEADLRSGRAFGPGWGVQERESWGELRRGTEVRPVEPVPGCWPRFYELLAAALRGEGPLPVDPADAVAVLELLERVPEDG